LPLPFQDKQTNNPKHFHLQAFTQIANTAPTCTTHLD
jgi:hypothetical protein